MASCAPTRCGSAPPCIEEAFASIQSSLLIQQQQKSSINDSNARQSPSSESEEKLLSDPAYFAYYRAHVNLNPRLPPPVPSRERQSLVHNGAGFKNFLIRQRLLPTCIEEHKQDQPTKRAHSFVGRSRSFVDLTQADVPLISSADPSSGLAIQRSNSFSAYENLENSIPPYSPAITKPEDNSQDEVSAQRGVKSDSTGTETLLRALNISLTSAEERAERKHDKVLLSDSRIYRHPDHHQVQRVQVPSSSHSSDYSYAVHAELSSSHGRVLGVKPSVINQVPIPALYASREAYMISWSNPLHHNLHRPGTLQLQHNLGGYSLPFGYNSPYAMGHSMSFDPYIAGYIQYMNKVYGQHGLMPHPSFASVLQGQFVQLPFKGGHVHPTHHNQWTGGIDNYCDPYSPLSSQRESSLAALMSNRNHTSGESGILASSSSYTREGCPSGGYDILSRGFNSRGEGNLGVQHSSHRQHSSGHFQTRGPRSSCNVEEATRNNFLEVQRSYWDGALELSHIAGRIVEFSADQHGSRFIQQKLESCSIQEKESVFSEVIPHTIELTTDVFGNYVIQKLFEHGSVEQRKRLADQIAGKILNLSLQMYGCRVIQKAIEVIEVDQKVRLVHELEGNVIKCVHDQNGNHVIQKCIQCIPAREIGFIISSFHGEVTTLSKHPYGCRVIQRILEHCSNYQASKFIVHDVLEHASSLACDQYGNYVVQHVMEMGKPSERSHIIDQLYGRFVEMSQHKFASNVVEKCLKHGDESEREAVIQELIGNPEENAAPLLTMMKDQYANYVVQRILDVCDSERREAVVNCIQGNMDGLRKYTYGKHIVARYNKLSGGLAEAGENTESS